MYEQHSNTDEPLVMTEKDVCFLREHVAPTGSSAMDDLTFDVCPGCARPIWRQTAPNGTGQTIVRLGADLCVRCESFRFRHPEVFDFVMTHAQAGRFIHARLKPKAAEGGGP